MAMVYGNTILKPQKTEESTINIILSPAYGRDYKSIKAVTNDFNSDKDFIIETFMHPYCGKPCNKRDLKTSGIKSVHIRYNKLQRVAVLTI